MPRLRPRHDDLDEIYLDGAPSITISGLLPWPDGKKLTLIDNVGSCGAIPCTIRAPINGQQTFSLTGAYSSVTLTWADGQFNLRDYFPGGSTPPPPSGAVAYINTSSGPVAYSLPLDHSEITVKDNSGLAEQAIITITDPGGALIDGLSSFVIRQNYGAYTFRWNGTAWRIF